MIASLKLFCWKALGRSQVCLFSFVMLVIVINSPSTLHTGFRIETSPIAPSTAWYANLEMRPSTTLSSPRLLMVKWFPESIQDAAEVSSVVPSASAGLILNSMLARALSLTQETATRILDLRWFQCEMTAWLSVVLWSAGEGDTIKLHDSLCSPVSSYRTGLIKLAYTNEMTLPYFPCLISRLRCDSRPGKNFVRSWPPQKTQQKEAMSSSEGMEDSDGGTLGLVIVQRAHR